MRIDLHRGVPEHVDDPATFAYYLERSLTGEQLARSIAIALFGDLA